MVYLWKKTVGNKNYYYLRVSRRNGSKVVSKDVAYLGTDLSKLRIRLEKLPKKYSKQIRKAYKTLNSFIEVNRYLHKVKALKVKSTPYILKSKLEELEACKLHWTQIFEKLDSLTKNEILEAFLIQFAYNTTSMEGNTITLKEAEELLLENLTPAKKSLREVYDLQNQKKVFFKLFKDIKKQINHKLIIKIHGDLLDKIDIRKGYRTTDIRVFKSTFDTTPGHYVQTDMDLLLKWYEKYKSRLHPFALATLFHHKFVRIHPFMDGNGRTGRMLVNYILMSNNYPPMIFRKKNRKEYLNELGKLDKIGLNEINPKKYNGLVEFSAKEFIDSYWNIFL